MGSSSSSRSGWFSSSRHSATRRASPPDRLVTSASPGGQAQRVHGDVDVPVEVVRALGGDLGLEVGLLGADLVVVGVGVGVAGQHLVVRGEQPGHLGDAVEHVALDVLVGVEVRLLLEQADGEAGGEACLAGELRRRRRP